jgi:hypothetical protein
MSTIGIILTAYNMADLLRNSLTPWIRAKEASLAGHNWLICGVSVPFEGFDEPRSDETLEIMHRAHLAGHLDHLILSDSPMKETEARGAALKWLVGQGITCSWQVDADEAYTTEQISAIVKFVEARPLVPWFRLCLRNLVFDRQTYLTQPFTPPRIHQIDLSGGWRASAFWDDNNVLYCREGPVNERREIRDVQLAHVTVPKGVAWIDHLSWLSDSRSKRKVAYQTARKWTCSFDWDDAKGGLIWRAGQPIPETATL